MAVLTTHAIPPNGERQLVGGHVPQYEVRGLPDGHRAWLGLIEGHWHIFRIVGNTPGAWIGPYESPDAAVTVLQRYYRDF